MPFTEDQAKRVAKLINGTFARPEKRDKKTNEVTQDAAGKRVAKVGKHTTNGAIQHVVHVTTEDHREPAVTVSSPLHPLYPLAA